MYRFVTCPFFHSLFQNVTPLSLVCIISSERYDNHFYLWSYVINKSLSLAAFEILLLVLCYLIMIPCDVVLFMFLALGVSWLCICGFIAVIKFGKFGGIFLELFFLSPFPFFRDFNYSCIRLREVVLQLTDTLHVFVLFCYSSISLHFILDSFCCYAFKFISLLYCLISCLIPSSLFFISDIVVFISTKLDVCLSYVFCVSTYI